MKKMKWLVILMVMLMVLSGCSTSEETGNTNSDAEESSTMSEQVEIETMYITVNGKEFEATFEDNEAVDEFKELLKSGPITISMSDYSGFEKVGNLGTSLTSSNKNMTTESGDIVLYDDSQIVIFYGSNTWSYTKLAHVDDLNGWEETLGSGDVSITFSIK